MQRPTAVTVFGILNIIFGIMGIVCAPIGFLMGPVLSGVAEMIPESHPQRDLLEEMLTNPDLMAYTYVHTALRIAGAAFLLAAGIGLLKLRPWGRYVSIGYAIYALVSTIVGGIFSYYVLYAPILEKISSASDQEAIPITSGATTGIFGSCFSLVYPIVLLIFMFLPDVKAAFQPGWGTPPPPPEPPSEGES